MTTIRSSRPIEYSHLKPLGEGAFSTVYRATRKDVEFGIEQTVAIKILKSQIPVDDWRNEFELLARVTSSRCVRVLGWDYLDNQPALVLELVPGVTLERLIKHYNLSPALTEEILSQLFEGLQDISRAGISHGDLSLKNVMVNDLGEIKILDFGLYKGGRGQFTPEFAAPEIFEQLPPTFFSDLYSLGRISYFIETNSGREISAATLKMLALHPEDRDFLLPYIEPTKRAQRREELAILVRDLLEKKTGTSTSFATTVLWVSQSKWVRKALWRAVCGIALSFNLMTASATADRRPGHIYIRTTQWSEVKMNNRSLGFSPLDIEVPSNETLHFEFKTPQGRILRTLTVSPGQNIVLDDSFVKHPSGDIHGKQLVQ